MASVRFGIWSEDSEISGDTDTKGLSVCLNSDYVETEMTVTNKFTPVTINTVAICNYFYSWAFEKKK